MKATAKQSSELKAKFKDYWKAHGGVTDNLPDQLQREATRFPLEYGEAYHEYLEYGWEN